LAEQELVSTEGLSQPQGTADAEQSSEFQLAEQALDPQERLFCYEYLTDYDHRRAAQAVERSPKAGVKLLRKPAVARFIRLLSDELAQESLITRDMVQYELLHGFLPRAKGEIEISGVDRDGVEFSAKVTNMAAYGKAIDLMAKHSGFTVPEVVAGGLTINVDLGKLGIRGTTVEGEYTDVE
jgi:hypothetical protein